MTRAATFSGQSGGRAMVILFGALMVGLLLTLAWVGRHAHREEMRRGRLILSIGLPMGAGRPDCLQRALRLAGRGGWKSVRPGTVRRFNAARHIRVDLHRTDGQDWIEVYTRDGRPLRAREAQALRACLAR